MRKKLLSGKVIIINCIFFLMLCICPSYSMAVGSNDIVVVFDCSASMKNNMNNDFADKLLSTIIKAPLTAFVKHAVTDDTRVGIVACDNDIRIISELDNDTGRLKDCIDDMKYGSSTNLYGGLAEADRMLKAGEADNKNIILITDGKPNFGPVKDGSYEEAIIDYSEVLKKRNYTTYVINCDKNDNSDIDSFLNKISDKNGFYKVKLNPLDITDVFENSAIEHSLLSILSKISGKRKQVISVKCPVDVTVTYNNEKISEENPEASFGKIAYIDNIEDEDIDDNNEENDSGTDEDTGEDDNKKSDSQKYILLDADKEYDIDIAGYDDGKMDLEIAYPNEDGIYDDIRRYNDIKVSPSMRATFNTAREDVSRLKIDQNGDGNYEITCENTAGGEMSVYRENNSPVLIIILITLSVIVLAVVIVLIVLLIKKNSNKNKSIRTVNDNERQIAGIFNGKTTNICTIKPGMVCTLGRDATCNITINHNKISRIHCELELADSGEYIITDRSSNGTFYNGQRLPKGVKAKIPTGSKIEIVEGEILIKLN